MTLGKGKPRMVDIDSNALVAAVGRDQVMELLTSEQYTVLVNGAGLGLPYAEIARQFNMPLGTVKSALNRARKKLLKQISERCKGSYSDDGLSFFCPNCNDQGAARIQLCMLAKRLTEGM